jgi:hypothetical protein
MSAAAAGASAAPSQASSAGGQNPFQIATNLYAEKNLNGLISSQLLTTTPLPGGGQINAGQYLRGLRLIVRTVTNGATMPVNGDIPFGGFSATAGSGAGTGGDGQTCGIFSALDLVNVDGSEILYNMNGFSYYTAQRLFRPWLTDPALAYDFVATATVNSFTLFLQPEIRFGAGCLANTDTRSQYRWDQSLVGHTGAGTQPTISVTPYMDAWAQPDATDLQGTQNQPVPPGVNLQVKRRHQIFTLNGSGSDNILLSTLTGNAIRGMAIIARDTTGVRQGIFSDPFYWTVDNRSLGKLNPDIISQWANDQLQSEYNKSSYPGTGNTSAVGTAGGQFTTGQYQQGVYPFLRFMLPGELYGQGWLYSSNATKIQFESATATLTAGAAGTAELVSDEVYPVGPVDPALVDI